MGAILVAVTFVGYAAAAVLYVTGFYDSRWFRWARRGAWIGWISQSVWLARTAWILNAFPAVTLYDWVAFFVWLSLALFLAGQIRRSLDAVGGFLVPIVFVIWLVSQTLSKHIADLPSSLTGPWLGVHVALATASYTMFLLSAVFGIMYIEKERELKNKRVRLFYYRLPPLGEMDVWGARAVMAGLPLLTVAIYVGAVWAKVVWGHYWSWSPKETWSLLTWAVYFLYLVLRWAAGWRGHRAAVLSMTAFLFVVANFFGINLLVNGAHSHNF